MAVASLKFDKGWKQYANATDPKRFFKALKKHVREGTKRNVIVARKFVRQKIKAGVSPANAALTVSLKGGVKPIVGTPGADLWNSITYSTVNWNIGFVGTKRTSAEYNVAKRVHEGTAIRVTEKMRHMFRVLWWAHQNWRAGKPIPHLEGRARELWEMSKIKRFFPLESTTRAIIIPKRPYIRRAFQDPKLKSIVEENWSRSVQNAINELAKK